jgi:hypothetical protein
LTLQTNYGLQKTIAIGTFAIALTLLSDDIRAQQTSDSVAIDESPTTKNAPLEVKLDRLWFGPGKPNLNDSWELWSSHYVDAEIIRLDAEQLEVRDPSGTVKTLELNRLIFVQPQWDSAEATELNTLYENGQFAEFAKKAPPVIQSSIAPWQQRLLLAKLIASADSIGNRVPAAKLFISLCDNSSPPMLLNCAPLNWAQSDSSASMKELSQQWLSDSREAAMLVGASWSLSDNSRDKAIETLEKLTRSTNDAISQLAEAQLWRIKPIGPKNLSEILLWQNRRDHFLLPLQLGPTELIADRWRSAQKPTLAAFEYLRIALLHKDRYDRRQFALKQAEALLNMAEHQNDAQKLKALYDAATKP